MLLGAKSEVELDRVKWDHFLHSEVSHMFFILSNQSLLAVFPLITLAMSGLRMGPRSSTPNGNKPHFISNTKVQRIRRSHSGTQSVRK